MALHVDPLKRELLEARIQGAPSPNVVTQTGKSQDVNSNQLSTDGRFKFGTSYDSVQNTGDVVSMDNPINTMALPQSTLSLKKALDGQPSQISVVNVGNSALPNSFQTVSNQEHMNSSSANRSEDLFTDLQESLMLKSENLGSDPSKAFDSLPSSNHPAEVITQPLSSHAEENSLSINSLSGDGSSNKGIAGFQGYSQNVVSHVAQPLGSNRPQNIVPYSNSSALSNQSVSFDIGCQSIPLLPPNESSPVVINTSPKKARNLSGTPAVTVTVSLSSPFVCSQRVSGLNSLSTSQVVQPTTPRSSIRRKRKGPLMDEQGGSQAKRSTNRGNKRIDEIFKVTNEYEYIHFVH